MQEMQVQSLGREDPRQKDVTTHSRILSWIIPQREEPGGLQSSGLQKNGTLFSDWACMRTAHSWSCDQRSLFKPHHKALPAWKLSNRKAACQAWWGVKTNLWKLLSQSPKLLSQLWEANKSTETLTQAEGSSSFKAGSFVFPLRLSSIYLGCVCRVPAASWQSWEGWRIYDTLPWWHIYQTWFAGFQGQEAGSSKRREQLEFELAGKNDQ